ncbi:hypothetical protein DL771_008828 [Monosporascus sp. 5C6A]|nr:hypothetical protein DL771_008828 [Monosporascus sp. 5C6A]
MRDDILLQSHLAYLQSDKTRLQKLVGQPASGDPGGLESGDQMGSPEMRNLWRTPPLSCPVTDGLDWGVSTVKRGSRCPAGEGRSAYGSPGTTRLCLETLMDEK